MAFSIVATAAAVIIAGILAYKHGAEEAQAEANLKKYLRKRYAGEETQP